MNNMKKYENIIDLPHHTSDKRPRMSRENRAVQFSPFAALTGYNAEINETARLTDEKLELSEDRINDINTKLQIIMDNIDEYPEVTVEYFVPDEKKSGGSYIKIIGNIRRIDEHERILIMKDNHTVPIDDIYSIDGKIFSIY
ncbi:MAG: hypothetical protein IJY19_02800 [Ruminococcus sp.]|nr:hypothetical protein [Ruminococcus sp.]